MQALPQELVDMIIDELANTESLKRPDNLPNRHIVPFSLVSKAWVTRTQKHAFEFIIFDGPAELERWRESFEPDPAGVSRHARYLVFSNISTLGGTEAHIRAFTSVELMQIRAGCNFLLSPSVVECFAPMGNLVELAIGASPTTSHIITSLLAAFPRLERFGIQDSTVRGDMDETDLLPRMPFFEGGNLLQVYSNPDQPNPPGALDWIPPSARFNSLSISAGFFPHEALLVNRWFSNSYAILTSLAILGDPYCKSWPLECNAHINSSH